MNFMGEKTMNALLPIGTKYRNTNKIPTDSLSSRRLDFPHNILGADTPSLFYARGKGNAPNPKGLLHETMSRFKRLRRRGESHSGLPF